MPMPTPRYGMATVLLADGKILVAGGQYASNFTDGVSATVEIFDPVANTWAPLPSLPEGRYMGSGAVRADGTVLVGGGLNANAQQARAGVYALAPGASAWTVESPMTSPRTSVAMAAGADGTTYAFGGNAGGTDLATAEARGPSAAGFATLPLMPAARGSGHSAVRGTDGKLVVVGGGNVPVLVFDPGTRTWSTGPVPPTCQWNAATAVAADGTIYAMGGETSTYISDVIALGY